MTTATLSVPTAPVPRMIATLEEFLAIPEDGMDRYVIRGELREKPMTVRNRFHGHIMTRVAAALMVWLERQPTPRGDVLTGDAGVRLPGPPMSVVGIDVAYISSDVLAAQKSASTLIDGVPTVAVEILSPSDTQMDVVEKTDLYLAANVPLVWILDPHWQTVTVYRPGVRPQLFNLDQELTAEPHLPGFGVKVARFFE